MSIFDNCKGKVYIYIPIILFYLLSQISMNVRRMVNYVLMDDVRIRRAHTIVSVTRDLGCPRTALTAQVSITVTYCKHYYILIIICALLFASILLCCVESCTCKQLINSWLFIYFQMKYQSVLIHDCTITFITRQTKYEFCKLSM